MKRLQGRSLYVVLLVASALVVSMLATYVPPVHAASITLSPTSGSPPVNLGGTPTAAATEVIITGSTFLGNNGCQVSTPSTGFFIDRTGLPACSVSSTTGALTVRFRVGAGSTFGAKSVVVTGTVNGVPSSDTASATFTVDAKIMLSAGSGPPGTVVSVYGSGFSSASGACVLTGTPVILMSCDQDATGHGTIVGQFSVASIAAGSYFIQVDDSGGPPPSAFAPFLVTGGTGPSLIFSPNMSPTGTSVTTTGSGWNPTDVSVTLTAAGPGGGVFFSGVNPTTFTCSVSGASISNCQFTVKSDAAGALGGTYTITATGSQGDSAVAQFLVQSTFVVAPNSGLPLSTGTFSGSGYLMLVADCSSGISGFPSPLFSAVSCSITAGGLLSGTYTVDAGAAPGAHTVTISGIFVQQGSISVPFTVVVPSITLTPSVVTPGVQISVAGSGFSTSDTGCTITGSVGGLVTSPTCSKVSGSASLAGTFTVGNVGPGVYTITVTGTPTNDAASTTLTVVTQVTTTSTVSSFTSTTTSSTSTTTTVTTTGTSTSISTTTVTWTGRSTELFIVGTVTTMSAQSTTSSTMSSTTTYSSTTTLTSTLTTFLATTVTVTIGQVLRSFQSQPYADSFGFFAVLLVFAPAIFRRVKR